MKGLILLKVFSDLCLCYAVIDALPLLLIHDMPLYFQAALCGCGVWLGEMLAPKGKWWTGLLAMILPLSSLFLGNTLLELLLLLPGLMYSILIILRGAYALEYYDFLDYFKRMLTAYGCFAAGSFVLGYFEGMTGSMFSSFDVTAVILYGLLFTLPGIFLLRQLRMGPDSQARDRRLNAIQMAVVTVLIVVLAVVIIRAEGLIHQGLEFLVYGIMVLVGIIPMLIHGFLQWFLRDEAGYMEAVGTGASPTYYTGPMTFPSGTGIVETPPAEPGFPWWAAILILFGLCAFLVFMVRNLRKADTIFASEEELEDATPEYSVRASAGSNRSKVRKLYRQYLKFVRKKGQRLETDQTSQYIAEHAPSGMDASGVAELRQIYLKARYTHQKITKAEVEQAKAALKKTQKTSV